MTAPSYPANIQVTGDWIEVRAPYALRDALEAAGGWWDERLRAWMLEATPQNAVLLKSIIAKSRTGPEFDALLVAYSKEAVSGYDLRYTRDAPEIPGLVGESWAHQRRAYADAMSRPATMLAMGMGSGKTRVAIGAILNRDVQRVLILCPRSVVPVWPSEVAKHAERGAWVLALDSGSVAEKMARAKGWLDYNKYGVGPSVVVVNYDSARMEPFRSWSLTAGFDMVVLDESHRAKAPGGVTGRYVAALGKQAKYRLALSGTPAAHSPLDLYGQFRFLDPSVFGTSFVRFRMRYAVMGGFQNHEVIGYQNVEEFNRKFHALTFQVGREVLDLPEATEVSRYTELGAEGRRVYRELERNFYAAVEAGELTIQNALSKALRLSQVANGAFPTDEGTVTTIDSAKKELLQEVLEEIGDAPIVVFCRFHHDLDAVREAVGGNKAVFADDPSHPVCAGWNSDVLELSGRRNELAAWQAGEGRVLAVQIQSGSVGIDLTRASYAVFYSVGWSLGELDQARARIHRPGQTRPVTNVRLIVKDTIDLRIWAALAARRDVIESLLKRRD